MAIYVSYRTMYDLNSDSYVDERLNPEKRQMPHVNIKISPRHVRRLEVALLHTTLALEMLTKQSDVLEDKQITGK